ncbi:MAG TPA: hypothetical protein VK137_03250, partial [Planctomycetaceae bacterium]|nr:hypothetical protein [Planctomycetaceae bacterium]
MGLAQNLFGITLDKLSGDDDLLDEDMFKVELPKPPEPSRVETPPVVQSELEFTPAEEVPSAAARPAPVSVTRPSPAKIPKAPKVTASVSKDEPFGAGLEGFGIGIDDVAVAAECVAVGDQHDAGLTLEPDFDDGLTLPEDQDAEGLTLSDDLTLAPEAAAD